jgi:hypothetical protein
MLASRALVEELIGRSVELVYSVGGILDRVRVNEIEKHGKSH